MENHRLSPEEARRQLSEIVKLTPEEEARLKAVPFNATANNWKRFASSIHNCVLQGYEAGEIEFPDMMQVMWDCSLGCTPAVRMAFQAQTSVRALKIKPKYLGRRKPPYPQWFQLRAAPELVLMLLEDRHDAPLREVSVDKQTLAAAIKWLEPICLAHNIHGRKKRSLSPSTLRDWTHAAAKERGLPVKRRGRPSAT